MYDDLIKDLREWPRVCIEYTGSLDELHDKAADAIERLSTYVQMLEELRKDGWYLQKTKMMTDGQAIMTMPLPKPPKEEK